MKYDAVLHMKRAKWVTLPPTADIKILHAPKCKCMNNPLELHQAWQNSESEAPVKAIRIGCIVQYCILVFMKHTQTHTLLRKAIISTIR